MLSSNKFITSLILSSLMFISSIGIASAAETSDVKTMTIAEIFANKDSLKGKKVQVKGKVVKVSRNIMKYNWIHIQDGTGEKGTNKIIFRSKTQHPEVNSEVLAQGVIDTDLDFGYGYTYSILVEDASFSQ